MHETELNQRLAAIEKAIAELSRKLDIRCRTIKSEIVEGFDMLLDEKWADYVERDVD